MKCAYPQRVNNDLIQRLPIVKFSGKIVLVETLDGLEDALAQMKKEKLLGFDTETKPNFQRGAQNKVSILQLAGEDTAWIFRLEPLQGNLERLYSVLADASVKKVGLAINGDLRALTELKDFKPAGFDEISRLTQKIGIINTGMKNLCGAILAERISKSSQLSNWASPSLTQKQLDYAATDAWISRRLYKEAAKILKDGRHALYVDTPPAMNEEPLIERFKRAFRKLFA